MFLHPAIILAIAFGRAPADACTGPLTVPSVIACATAASPSLRADRERVAAARGVEGRDMASVVADARRAVDTQVAREPGYPFEWSGTFRHYEQAKARLLWVVPVALGFIVFLLWSAFAAARPVAISFLTVPFALVGGVVALWVRGIPFSISAGIGFIALLGVAVLNGLILVTVARRTQAADEATAHDAIEWAARLRLRPVLMTALTDILGFVPMALSTAPGAEVQRPLATVVFGGVMSATILTLVVLPAVYSVFGGAGEEVRPRASCEGSGRFGMCGVPSSPPSAWAGAPRRPLWGRRQLGSG